MFYSIGEAFSWVLQQAPIKVRLNKSYKTKKSAMIKMGNGVLGF